MSKDASASGVLRQALSTGQYWGPLVLRYMCVCVSGGSVCVSGGSQTHTPMSKLTPLVT